MARRECVIDDRSDTHHSRSRQSRFGVTISRTDVPSVWENLAPVWMMVRTIRRFCSVVRTAFTRAASNLPSVALELQNASAQSPTSFPTRTVLTTRHTHAGVCPVCRKARYESKMTLAAVTAARSASAVRVQMVVRALLARRKCLRRRREFYGRGLGDPEPRRRFLEREVVSYVDRIERRISERADNLDALFAQCEDAVKMSTLVMGEVSQAARARESIAPDEDGVDARICEPAAERPPTPTEAEWRRARARAALRAERACAICMGTLEEQEEQVKPRPVLLLSCSHVYHRQCLRALEAFAIAAPLCPCCRSPYRAVDYRGGSWVRHL